MTIRYIALVLLLLLAVISDNRTYKIKNSLHGVFILIGLGLGLWQNGLKGGAMAMAGMIIPILILLPLFALRMLGAGDIKLFASIGAIMGSGFVLNAMIYSFLSGGLMALLLMILRKNGRERLRHLAAYMKTCFLTLSLQPYTDFNDKSDGAKFRFSYAIACGCAAAIVWG